ncbi:HlyD family type I secretion periplasmic adaptor subunit [Paracoccaceae bacterium GXU_MW_L88]
MRYDQIDQSIGRSLRKQIVIALAVIGILFGGAGSVAALAEISGAVVGMGKLIVEGRPKNVQHLDGGTVKEILVQEGQSVEAGQPLFRLDPTVVNANLSIVNSQIDTLLAQEARLEAELLNEAEITFPETLTAKDTRDAEVLMTGQRELMKARSAAREGRRNQLTAQKAQLEEKLTALQAQREAVEVSLGLAAEEMDSKAELAKKGLVRDTEFRSAKRVWTDLGADIAALDAQRAETQEEILRRDLEYAKIDEDYREEVLTILDEKRAELAQLQQEKIAAEDRRNRLSIVAPIGGQLHELAVHTEGQVISPGETLVTLIAVDGQLIVESKLPPQDVDQVYQGQSARLRFSGLDQRTTPQVNATVLDVSPDASTDEMTGNTYYLARLAIDQEALAQIEHAELRPGMPVEVFIETTPRTILSYLVKPMVDQIQHAMRE